MENLLYNVVFMGKDEPVIWRICDETPLDAASDVFVDLNEFIDLNKWADAYAVLYSA